MISSPPYLKWLASWLTGRNVSGDEPLADDDRHVLGFALGYSESQIRPFVLSLREHFDGAVALAIDGEDDALRAFLVTHRIQAVPAPRPAGWAPHVVVGRFAVFEQLLRRMRPDAAVLLTDVRDVVFQGDPLAPRPSRIEVFDEQGGAAFGAHAFNRKHARALAGPEIARLLDPRVALCVGTVAGPAHDLARLCRLMLMLCARPRSARGGAFGADQAAFNLAVHLDLVDAWIRPNYSRVATVGAPDAHRVGIRGGVIVNADGSVSPVVHQYDRRPELVQLVQDRWGAGEAAIGRRPPAPQEAPRRLLGSIAKRMPELR